MERGKRNMEEGVKEMVEKVKNRKVTVIGGNYQNHRRFLP